VELSDIAAFLELPDGKVLSGSEAGALLLWDGGLIKVVLTRPGGAPCHAGAIELLHHDAATNYVLSGGADGVLRLWDYTKLCEAEPAEGCHSAEVKPAAEVALPPGCHVKGAVWLKGRWLVLDERGVSHVVSRGRGEEGWCGVVLCGSFGLRNVLAAQHLGTQLQGYGGGVPWSDAVWLQCHFVVQHLWQQHHPACELGSGSPIPHL
jgi:hypothetical protein